MRKHFLRWGWLLMLVAAVVLLRPATAQARGVAEGKVVFGGEYTLPAGKVLDGDLTVVGGAAHVAERAVVTGDVRVIGGMLSLNGVVEGDLSVTGGKAVVDGTVRGDVSVLGGEVTFGKHAIVHGEVHTVGGDVQREPGARVHIVPAGPEPPFAFFWPGRRPFLADVGPVNFVARLLWRGVLAVFQALALAVLAAVLFLFLEGPARQVVDEIETAPLVATGVGLLTAALLPVVLLAMAITLLLLPLAVVVAVAVAALGLYGWLVLGLLLGERLAEVGHVAWHPALSGAAGTFLLTLGAGLLNVIPCVGWIPGFLAEAMGLGAVLLVLWEGFQQHRSKHNGERVVVDAASSEGPTASV